ncbi:MAG TPA: hypothetical protein VLO11_15090 [Luteolibacter sp.]|nr:hypothetical protein [Luteolibacter sp.]
MSMLSDDPGAGLATSLLGIVVLVMTGIGFSVVVEKRMRSSKAGSVLQRELQAGEHQLAGLKARHDRLQQRLLNDSPARIRGAEALAALPEPDTLAARAAQARARLATLKRGIPELEREFAQYRADCQRHAWGRAVGESLGDFHLPGGRVYHEAVIRQITDEGILIRHRHGSARIPTRDLDERWRDRLQLK